MFKVLEVTDIQIPPSKCELVGWVAWLFFVFFCCVGQEAEGLIQQVSQLHWIKEGLEQ